MINFKDVYIKSSFVRVIRKGNSAIIWHSLFGNPQIVSVETIDFLNMFKDPIQLGTVIDKKISDADLNAIKELIHGHFLILVEFNERLFLEERMREREAQIIDGSLINYLELIVSEACNFRCTYCIHFSNIETSDRINDSKFMRFETAKESVDQYLKILNRHGKRIAEINFGGGEPLLDLVLVSEMVNFAKSCYKSVNLRVVTNGVFDEKTLKWICDNKADVRVSYDGVMHDKQRPFPDGSSSRNIVRMNIKELATIGLNPTVQCIVSNEGVNTICQTIDDVLNLRVKRIKIEPVLSTAVSRSGKAMEPNPVEYADRLLKAVEYVASLKIEFKIDTGYFTEPSTGFYCGISDPNKTVTPEGLITACVEVSRQNDPYAETVIYGKIINGNICFDSSKRNLLRSLHFNNQQGGCIDCNLRLICQGGCPMANIWRSGFPYKKSGFTCAVEKFLIPKLLLGIAENPEIGKVVLDTGAKMC